MRRDRRKASQSDNVNGSDKVVMYVGIAIAVLGVITIAMFIYSNSLNNSDSESITYERFGSVTNAVDENTQSASSQMGKTVEEAANETDSENTAGAENKANNTSTPNNKETTNNTTSNTKTSNANANVEDDAKEEKAETKKVELSFTKPVEGDIVKEFSNEQLVYSETLKEWTTHLGIDIKADKASVVTAAEAGTVKSIKNDPRYGLTIVIEHQDGFQTVYSNLLTSEFVVEGEDVEKGQTIGTVGNTSSFEVADETHLHFEIWKDSQEVNPTEYIK